MGDFFRPRRLPPDDAGSDKPGNEANTAAKAAKPKTNHRNSCSTNPPLNLSPRFHWAQSPTLQESGQTLSQGGQVCQQEIKFFFPRTAKARCRLVRRRTNPSSRPPLGLCCLGRSHHIYLIRKHVRAFTLLRVGSSTPAAPLPGSRGAGSGCRWLGGVGRGSRRKSDRRLRPR